MQWTMTRPCENCPFLREGGIRLTVGRAREIARMMLHSQGGMFPCHKSVDYEEWDQDREIHCAGALAFAEVNGAATQMMRIAERLGLYDHTKITAETRALVFGSGREMVAANRKARFP